MPKQVRLHQLEDLSNEECQNKIFLQTKLNTQLQIVAQSDRTIISLPYGNKFDVVDGCIIIHEK